MISALGTMGGIIGYTIGGVLVTKFGPHENYLANALAFGVSALCVWQIAPPARAHTAAPLAIWRPLINGFRYVLHHRRIMQMIAVGVMFWGAAGVVIACVPAIVRDVFGGDVKTIGYYRGLLVAGMALGAGIVTALGKHATIRRSVIAGLLGASGFLALLTVTYARRLGAIPAGVALVGAGASGAILLVTVMATIQRFVPDTRRGRVFGVCDMCTMAAVTFTSAVLGLPNIPHLDHFVPWLLGGTAAILFAALAAGLTIYAAETRRRVAVLRRHT
jgi:MFS family permease